MEKDIREAIVVGGQAFTFSLCQKVEQMGGVPVNHWWMKTTEVYAQRAQRRSRHGNYQEVTNCFWAQCREGNSTDEPDVQESFILAKLLPFTRNQGSRRVFADACQFPPERRRLPSWQESIRQMEDSIHSTRNLCMTRAEFEEKTTVVLGPPKLGPDLVQTYKEFCAELLEDARSMLLKDEQAGIELAIQRWMNAVRSVGRRAGHSRQKQVLDVISYEARASLHRCYSAVWSLLLPHLQAKYVLSQETVSFLGLWHFDQVDDQGPNAPAYWHLFHGHVFALHPASGHFLCTSSGRALVGDWLQHPGCEEAFGRLLHGIYIAVHHYAGQREWIAQTRKKEARGGDLIQIEEQQQERRRGLRRRKVRKGDAC